MWWAIIIVPVLALLAWPFWREARKGDPLRKQAPGAFAATGRGRTHYQWHGPARGPVVVAIHGLTTPSPVWDGVVPGLLALGYRVLVYDLYGRGYSDAPRGRQDRRFFLGQLTALLASQGLTQDLTLVGFSMGGAIATAFAAENPDRMKRLVLIAPSGIVATTNAATRFEVATPVLGDWLHAMRARARMRAALAAEPPPGPGALPDIAALRLAEIDRRGFLPAVLSSRRAMLVEVQEADHRAIAATDIPVVALFGDKDPVVPLRALGTLTAWNRGAQVEVIANAGHDLPALHGPEVTAVLRDVLREG